MEIAGQDAELPEIRHRVRLFFLFVAAILLVLAGRLFYLQIVEGDTYFRLTADNIVRTVTLPPMRGQIRDRKGRVLATTRPAYRVMVTPSRLDRYTYDFLRRTLEAHHPDFPTWETLKAPGDDRLVQIAEDLPWEPVAAIATALDLQGVRVLTTPRRHYPWGSMAAHLIGYMNEISADDLRARPDEGYRAGDLIGRTGIERQWEPYLRGQKGFEKTLLQRRSLRRANLQIDALVDGPVKRPPSSGNDLVLTLDVDIQRAVEAAMRNLQAAGAAVIDVATGRVLALASRPRFDPNEMSGGLSFEEETRLLSNPFRTFRDKSLSEAYNPGSIFKPLTALAALEERVISPEDRTKCVGYVQVGRRRFKCTKVHGVLDLAGAIVQSCNSYFFELSMRPGMMNRMAKFAADFGLGAPSGLGVNGEAAGFVPTEEWHMARAAHDKDTPGFVVGHALNLAIGQGALRTSVLQMALVYATIANGGKLFLPQIVERIESPEGQVIEEFPPRHRRDVSVSPASLEFMRRALVGVVNLPKGTAYKARSPRVTVAGKTGTAQVQERGRYRRGGVLPYEAQDHAWFAGFAPAEKPRVAAAVLVEHGGWGADVAAPVAVQILEETVRLLEGGQR